MQHPEIIPQPILGRTIVMPIVQNKGGSGKSTTAVNLGAELAARGFEVVIIDMDPQTDTTFQLLGEPPEDEEEPDPYRTPNLFTVLALRVPQTLWDLVQPTGRERLWIIPGHFWVTELEAACDRQLFGKLTLHTALDNIRGYFDFVIIDCPSWMGFPTQISVLAGDYIVIPVQAQPRSLRASTRTLHLVRDMVAQAERHLRGVHSTATVPEVLGMVLTMRKHSNGQIASAVLREEYPDGLVFDVEIPYREIVARDVVYHAPLREYAPDTDEARRSYAALAEEILARLGLTQ